jgi:hypothetical protein
VPVSWSSTVADYVAELRQMRAPQFLVSYPHAVLVHRFGPPGGPAPAARFRTDLLTRRPATPVVEGGPRDLDVAVHAVKKRPGNLYEDTVMLGRAPSNDIVVPYGDLSKLHAYFRRSPDGGWLVADAGSTNGTWLGSEPLAPNEPAPLGERSELAFGDSAFEFFTARGFAAWLEALEARL